MSRLVRRTSAALHFGPKRPPPGCGGHARTLRTVLSGSGLTHRVTRRPSVAYSITCTGRSTSCARGPKGRVGRGIAQRQRSGAGGDRSAHARGCRAGWAAAAMMRRGCAQRFAPAAPEAQRRPLSRARRRRGADTPLLFCPDARTRALCVQRVRACVHAHSPPCPPPAWRAARTSTGGAWPSGDHIAAAVRERAAAPAPAGRPRAQRRPAGIARGRTRAAGGRLPRVAWQRRTHARAWRGCSALSRTLASSPGSAENAKSHV